MAYLSRDALETMGFACLGQNVRISDKASIYDAGRMTIGDHSRIDDFCVISGKVSIGRNVHIAPFCLVAGGNPGVELMDFCGLAYRVSVFAQSDDYSGETMTNPTVPMLYKREVKAAVSLGRHVIAGTGAIIGPGVDVGEGAAIAAAAVVLSSVAPWTIVGGVPARKLKNRRKDLLRQEAAYLSAEDAEAQGSA